MIIKLIDDKNLISRYFYVLLFPLVICDIHTCKYIGIKL